MWIQEPNQIVQNYVNTDMKAAFTFSGLFIFGGLDDKNQPHNDLYLLQPHFFKNIKYVTYNTSNYKRSALGKIVNGTEVFKPAKLFYKLLKIEPLGGGQPPCPRHSHAASFFKNYLVIHGGRNDKVYPLLKNMGLNDLHLFDIEKLSWMMVSIYNKIPTSRWGHQICKIGEEKLLLFGGQNMIEHCNNVPHVLNFSK